MTDKRITILVVDDEPAVCQLIAGLFTAAEFSVQTAKDGVTALRLIDDPSADIDILLVDVAMPRLNGPELVRAVLSHHPDIKIIFMSGYPSDVLEQYGNWTSSILYIKKPFTPDTLMRAVRNVLGR